MYNIYIYLFHIYKCKTESSDITTFYVDYYYIVICTLCAYFLIILKYSLFLNIFLNTTFPLIKTT